MKHPILIVLCILFVSSCKKFNDAVKVEEGVITDNVYKSKELGWTMEIPEGWSLISLNDQIETNELGQEALEDYLEGEIEMSGLKNLIAFEKNEFNSFQSSSEAYTIDYEGEYKEINTMLKNLIYETFRAQGIKADTTATTTVTIDGLDFYTYTSTLFSQDGTKILTQEMYNSYINGLDFGANLNYNNLEDEKILRDAFLNSIFE